MDIGERLRDLENNLWSVEYRIDVDKDAQTLADARAAIARLAARLGAERLGTPPLHLENKRLTAERDRLRAALQRIDGINDNPARYNADIDAVLRDALEQNGRDKP